MKIQMLAFFSLYNVIPTLGHRNAHAHSPEQVSKQVFLTQKSKTMRVFLEPAMDAFLEHSIKTLTTEYIKEKAPIIKFERFLGPEKNFIVNINKEAISQNHFAAKNPNLLIELTRVVRENTSEFIPFIRKNKILTEGSIKKIEWYYKNDKIGFDNILKFFSFSLLFINDEVPYSKKPALRKSSTQPVFPNSDLMGYLLPPSDDRISTQLTQLLTPRGAIGGYGIGHLANLMVTMRLLVETALREDFQESFNKVISPDINKTTDALVRARDEKFEEQHFSSPMRALIEGLLTIYQAFQFGTYTNLPSFPSGISLMEALAKRQGEYQNGFVAKLALDLPIAFLPTVTIYGKDISGAVELSPKGEVTVSKNLLSFFKKQRNLALKSTSVDNIPIFEYYTGCPMAYPAKGEGAKTPSRPSYVQLVVEEFMRVHRTVAQVLEEIDPS